MSNAIEVLRQRGLLLRALRVYNEKTQDQLADATNIKKWKIVQFEDGRLAPTEDEVRKIRSVLRPISLPSDSDAAAFKIASVIAGDPDASDQERLNVAATMHHRQKAESHDADEYVTKRQRDEIQKSLQQIEELAANTGLDDVTKLELGNTALQLRRRLGLDQVTFNHGGFGGR